MSASTDSKVVDKDGFAPKFATSILNTYIYNQGKYIDALHLINHIRPGQLFDRTQQHRNTLRNLMMATFELNCFVKIKHSSLSKSKATFFTPYKTNCAKCEKYSSVRFCQFKRSKTPFYECLHSWHFSMKPVTSYCRREYLNLIDCRNKSYECTPTMLINTDVDILLAKAMSMLKTQPYQMLPFFMRGLMSLAKLMNYENSERVQVVKFYYDIVEQILATEFPDPKFLLRVWQSMLISDRITVFVFERLTDKLLPGSVKHLQSICSMASYLKFDLYNAVVRGQKLVGFPLSCPVTESLVGAKVEKLRVLIDYGFLPNARPRERFNVLRKFLVPCFKSGDFFYEDIKDKNPLLREFAMYLFTLFRCRHSLELCAELSACFYLIWNSISDPLFTREQAEEGICLLFPAENIKISEIRQIALTKYDQMPWGKANAYEPRTLHHLCRVTIRNTMRRSGALPHKVSMLPLSESQKKYILIQC